MKFIRDKNPDLIEKSKAVKIIEDIKKKY